MNHPNQSKSVVLESANVGTVVQEYMDNLLGELFPDVLEDLEAQTEEKMTADLEPLSAEQSVVTALTVSDKHEVESDAAVQASDVQRSQAESDAINAVPQAVEAEVVEQVTVEQSAAAISEPEVQLQSAHEVEPQTSTETTTEETLETKTQEQASVYKKSDALRYPKAPVWAQQAFDVLLFDVCGLKLAVPMESLGKIIKVDHETNQLIGRPDWFIGAYIENEQHLYVVDTAQYIMPEKGFNLARDGFDYVIQLQRSKWTLACKKVHNTVRLEPDQVKWRSQQGKRQWLSGTVVDHMCALIHVDSLIDLLQAEAS